MLRLFQVRAVLFQLAVQIVKLRLGFVELDGEIVNALRGRLLARAQLSQLSFKPLDLGCEPRLLVARVLCAAFQPLQLLLGFFEGALAILDLPGVVLLLALGVAEGVAQRLYPPLLEVIELRKDFPFCGEGLHAVLAVLKSALGFGEFALQHALLAI